ncbi:MAG: hypothetical protein ABIA93_04175 [Candidatus Woesearchaeota archaeon]
MATTQRIIISALIILFAASLIRMSSAEPGGPDLTYIGNSSLDTSTPANRTDSGGAIHTISISAILQDQMWKAYVGNITGLLTLDDANGYTIYDWTLAAPTGEVYITRDSSVSWGSINCSNATHILTEQSSFLMQPTAVDNINKTFNETIHASFLVGTLNMTESSCQTAYTYVNDSKQTGDLSNPFQEVLLSDGSNLIYTTIIEADEMGYDPGQTYDFQAIVAENASSTAPDATYFFFVELG